MNSLSDLRNGSTPTVLLIHGAFADASSWAGVIAELQRAGIDVIAPANPLRGLTFDAQYIGSVADEIDGPTVLVGHSYGGAVITVAGTLTPNVLGLVYVTAFAVDEGESVLDVSTRFPDSLLAPALRPGTYLDANGEPAVELYIDREAFPRVFAQDLPGTVAAVGGAAQRPIASAAFEHRASKAAWKTLPCWYVVATADQVIDPNAQRFMAGRASAQTIEVDASHAVAASQPALVADHILAAALSVRPHSSSPNRPDDQPLDYVKDALG